MADAIMCYYCCHGNTHVYLFICCIELSRWCGPTVGVASSAWHLYANPHWTGFLFTPGLACVCFFLYSTYIFSCSFYCRLFIRLLSFSTLTSYCCNSAQKFTFTDWLNLEWLKKSVRAIMSLTWTMVSRVVNCCLFFGISRWKETKNYEYGMFSLHT